MTISKFYKLRIFNEEIAVMHLKRKEFKCNKMRMNHVIFKRTKSPF